MGWGWGYKPSKPAPAYVLPPVRLQLLKVPQLPPNRASSWGPDVQIHEPRGAISHSNRHASQTKGIEFGLKGYYRKYISRKRVSTAVKDRGKWKHENQRIEYKSKMYVGVSREPGLPRVLESSTRVCDGPGL